MREHRRQNPELVHAQQCAYRQRNKKAIAERSRTDEFRQKRAAQARQRRMSPEYRLRNALNARLAYCVAHPERPSDSFVKRFGYTPSDLRIHIERQFSHCMSWENYGILWEIDHIVPVASFKLPDQIMECWALSNLRPLPSVDNQSKGDKRIHLL